MKTLLFSTLYPNNVYKNFGVFVENRALELLHSIAIQTKVLAPVPWFPLTHKIFGKYSTYSKIVKEENRNGIDVIHPRYLVIPGIGMNISPYTLYYTALNASQQLIKDGFNFDMIDAHYFYPDGVAAVMLAKKLNKPVVITARGSDVNLLATFKNPRKKIVWAAENANHIITVSAALKEKILEFGIPERKITVLRNGVDLDTFKPSDDIDALKSDLGVSGKIILTVGNLVELKGHDLIIRALEHIPDATLLIAGAGEKLDLLKKIAVERGVQARVIFLGEVHHSMLTKYYASADVFVLASSREGWANVLLEAMACGTPVIASNVGGNAEMINKDVGLLLSERTSEDIAKCITQIFSSPLSRTNIRKHAESFSWDSTSIGQVNIFNQVTASA